MLLLEKSDELYRQLRNELLQSTPGNRFYSVRQMISRFNVSRRVVDATVSRLAGEGLIANKPCSGLFVEKTTLKPLIVLFRLDYPSTVIPEKCRRLEQQFAAHPKYDFSVIPYRYQADIIGLIRDCPANAVLLMSPARDFTREEVSFFASHSKPVIFLDRELMETPFYFTSVNIQREMMLILNCFKSHGHGRVAFLSTDPLVGNNLKRQECFRVWREAMEISGPMINCHAEDGNYASQLAYDALSEHLTRYGLDFSGLYVMSYDATKGAMQALRDFRLKIPDDVSIASSGLPHKDDAPLAFPLVTSAFSDTTHNLAEQILHWLESAPEYRKPFRVYYEPTMIDNRTVRHITE